MELKEVALEFCTLRSRGYDLLDANHWILKVNKKLLGFSFLVNVFVLFFFRGFFKRMASDLEQICSHINEKIGNIKKSLSLRNCGK